MSILRQAAFGGTDKLLKGGLHCHTTRSDGKGSPEDVIAMHIEHGYDFLAITDHRIYNYDGFGRDDSLLILPGMEMDYQIIQNDPDAAIGMCYHYVCLGQKQENGNPYRQDERFVTSHVRGSDEVKPLLDTLHANNQMTIYAHPEWSGTPARSFEDQEGHFAIEIYNSGCVLDLDMDADNGICWDELLLRGKRVYAVATDDGHHMSQHCRGWVRVRAQRTVEAILEALKNGAFYASCGPEIHDFYVDGDRAVVCCSPCARGIFRRGVYPLRSQHAENEPQTLFETTIIPGRDPYIRACVVDEQGRKAWTNPIFLA